MDDLISRQAAIDALNEYFVRIGKLTRRGLTKGEKAISLDTVGAIKTLPPAQPEPTDINAKEAVYNLAEKIGIHQLFALTVELRGEPIQPEPQWIPVSERLPETEEFVLASLTGKYRNITFEHACEIADYADGEWCVYAYPHMSAEKCEELIEAWMPLPKPFEGGAE